MGLEVGDMAGLWWGDVVLGGDGAGGGYAGFWRNGWWTQAVRQLRGS